MQSPGVLLVSGFRASPQWPLSDGALVLQQMLDSILSHLELCIWRCPSMDHHGGLDKTII